MNEQTEKSVKSTASIREKNKSSLAEGCGEGLSRPSGKGNKGGRERRARPAQAKCADGKPQGWSHGPKGRKRDDTAPGGIT